jgi:ethanolamine utilization protein EutN
MEKFETSFQTTEWMPAEAGRGIGMIIGKVVGSVVSTRKNENLVGNKFMIIEPVSKAKCPTGQLVAIDNIGAGIGEYVLVAWGSAARIGCGMEQAPIDAAIVGIIDNPDGLE